MRGYPSVSGCRFLEFYDSLLYIVRFVIADQLLVASPVLDLLSLDP